MQIRAAPPLAPTQVFLLARATLLSTLPLKRGQTGARGVEMLQRPEAGQGGFRFSTVGWGRLSRLALRLQLPYLAVA